MKKNKHNICNSVCIFKSISYIQTEIKEKKTFNKLRIIEETVDKFPLVSRILPIEDPKKNTEKQTIL